MPRQCFSNSNGNLMTTETSFPFVAGPFDSHCLELQTHLILIQFSELIGFIYFQDGFVTVLKTHTKRFLKKDFLDVIYYYKN